MRVQSDCARSLQKAMLFLLLLTTLLLYCPMTANGNHCSHRSGGGTRPPRQDPTYPLECGTYNIIELTTEVFNPIEADLEEYQCYSDLSLIFMIEVPGVLPYKIYIGNDSDWIYADHFDIGNYNATIRVCRNLQNSCFQNNITDLGSVILVVEPHSKRLFPNGNDYYYLDIRPAEDEDDVALTIRFSNSFPFFDSYYNQVYIVSNGLITLGWKFDHWWPTPIPYRISTTGIIAPYWTDLDFRNNTGNGGMYYHIYDVRKLSYRNRTDKIMEEFQRRLTNYTSNVTNFEPKWLLVVTWNNASPYPASYFHHERMTFQLVLATDYISTYGYYLYNDSNWDPNQAFSRPVTLGYDASDFDNYEQMSLPRTGDYFIIDEIPGNTGQNGEWYFNFTSSEAANPSRLCHKWSQDHTKFRPYLLGNLSCPCTYEQALLDWRFWFGYFWGVSSMQHCATFVFSQLQGTVECCYDFDGSLIVDSRYGGSFFRYNPLFYYQQHLLDDRQPRQHCCIDSNLCQLYHLHRLPSQCSQYNPPKSCFLFGGGHIKSIDGMSFTFNGIGEYWLLKSSYHHLSIQVRLIQFQHTNLTVVSAMALEYHNINIQVETRNRGLNLYVRGELQRLPNDNTVYIVTSNGIHSLSGLAIENLDLSGIAYSTNKLLVRASGSDTLLVTLPSGASLRISLQISYLQITIELSTLFMNHIRGLVGTFNDNVQDDFSLPDDQQAANIHSFGLAWHADRTDSIFTYFGSESHSTFNDNYEHFQPTFESNLDPPPDIVDVCHQDRACYYDYAITRDARLAYSTKNFSIGCQLLNSILGNRPPRITPGSPQSYKFIIRFTAFQNKTVRFELHDPDGDNVPIFSLKGAIANIGIQLYYDQNLRYGNISGQYLGYDLPSGNVTLYAEDIHGTSSARRISIILCACANGGTCVEVNTNETLELNEHGHFKEVCLCPEHYGGESCEIDMRGCSDNSCPEYSVCINNSSLPSGYYCSGCAVGYIFHDNKCTDIDECTTNNQAERDQCSQLCVNTEGSYICQCHDGYRLSADGRSCEDINECNETSSSCSQVCINTEGSFMCECHPGFVLGDDNSACEMVSCQNINPCHSSLNCTVAHYDQYQCICPNGRRCTGTCSGELSSANEPRDQLCEVCTGQKYGFNCSQLCDCGLHGLCDSSHGCMCDNGWGGIDCRIEYNNYSPVFDINTPSSVRVKYTRRPRRAVTGTVVVDINATDADAPSEAASNISYSLLTSSLPGVADCTTFLSIDPSTGVISANPNLETLAGNISECILTIKAEDNAVERRSATITMAVILLPVPIITLNPAESIQIVENLPEGSIIANASCTEIGPSSGSLSTSLRGAFIHYFHLDINQSILSVARTFDFETLQNRSRPLYEIEIVCQNRHGLTDIREVSIEIVNLDDNPFLFESDQYTVSIPENVTANETIIDVTAYDDDVPEGIMEYFLTNNSKYFSIDSTTGVVTVVSPLDREHQDQFLLEVVARQQETGQMTSVDLIIYVLDINDVAPMFVSQSYIVWNLTTRNEIGSHVITLLAVDPDLSSSGRVTYQLEENQFFIINETTGSVLVNLVLSPNLNLTLTAYAMDNGSPQLSSNTIINIFVHPSLDNVRFINSQYNFVVPEDEPIGSYIGQIEAFVIDDSNAIHEELQVTYGISSQSNSQLFTIRNQTGEIYLISELDYDLIAHQYQLNISAGYYITNGANLMSEVPITINVLNVNDNPPRFTSTFYATTVKESTPAGTSIIAVQTTDIDEISDITYSLEGEDSDSFVINSQTGIISATANLSVAQDYRFYAVASDGKLASRAVVHISVTRTASVIPTFTKEQYIFNISEKLYIMQTEVGRVQALLFGARHSYESPGVNFRISRPNFNTLEDANDLDLFTINEMLGTIRTTDATRLDAESQNTYIFYVEVFNNTDGVVFDKATVKIKIDDSNDNSPIFNQSLYTRVVEDSITFGSQILTVSASDHDSSTNADVTYSLSPITPGFAINSTSGEITKENATLIPGTYNLNILANDGGFPPQTGTVSAFITIIPTALTDIEFTQSVYSFEVFEDALVGYIIGNVATMSNETSVSYSTQTLNTCIFLNQTSGQIQVSCRLDRESQAIHELAVLANVGELVGRCKVVITVLDINEYPPAFLLDTYAEVINDNHGTDAPIIQVLATDLDCSDNDSISYIIFSVMNENMSDCATYFNINETNGSINSQESSLPVGNYLLLVQASDRSALNSTVQVFIFVTEVHLPYVFIDSASFTVRENLNPGVIVGYVTLIASGQIVNPGDHRDLLFTIVGGDTLSDLESMPDGMPNHSNGGGYPFGIDLHSGAIYTRVSLDYETAKNYIVTVRANFTYGISVDTTYTIVVTDDNDVTPLFQPSLYFGNANDTTQTGAVVATVTASDLDSGSNSEIHFEIDSDVYVPFDISVISTNNPFTVGEIYVTNSSEFTLLVYNFSIVAIDSGAIPLTGTAQVIINIAYELPDFISFTQDIYQFQVIENSPQVVGTVSIEHETPALVGLVFRIMNETDYFVINETNGIISTIGIDRESLPMAYTNLTISAFLPSEPFLEPAYTTVVIFVEDVNDNPPAFSRLNYLVVYLTTEISITEELIQLEAIDSDYGTNAQIFFSIESVSPETHTNDFYITENGSIYTNDTNLTAVVYSLNVSAQDMGTPSLVSSTATVSIIVQKHVPAFINFTEPHYTFQVIENADVGTHVGYVLLEELPDHVEPYISLLINNANFSIITTERELKTFDVFDYESRQSYNFTIEAWMIINNRIPPVNISTSASVTVFIINVDDNPPVFLDLPQHLSWLENRTSEEYLYRIAAVDVDTGGLTQQLEFEILNTDILDKFRIDNETGALYIAESLDREEQEYYTIIIQVSDSATPRNSVQGNINFTLLDINDNHPAILVYVDNMISEHLVIGDDAEVGTVIANISVTDFDVGSNGAISIQMDSGTPFDIAILWYDHPHTYGQLFVANISLLVPGLYPVNITAVDMGDIPLQSGTQVTVVVEYALPEFISFPQNIYQFRVVESSMGTEIGRVSVEQSTPALDGLVYRIREPGWEQFFAVNATSGAITNIAAINREIYPQINFTISASLPSELSLQPAQTIVVVFIEDINDNYPIFTQALYSQNLLTTDISTMHRILQVTASDADSGSNALVSFHIENVCPQEYTNDFYVTQDGSIFTNNTNLNATTYHLTILARDMGAISLASTANITLTVTIPIQDTLNFTQPEGYTFPLRENIAPGTIIGRVRLDQISSYYDQYVSFSASHINFSVDTTTGLIRALNMFDYEQRQNYTFQVVARLAISSRTPGPPIDLTSFVNVTVLIIDVNDNIPIFMEFPFSLTWPENGISEELIYQVVATDADSDNNQLLVYEIVDHDLLNKFRIDNRTGELYVFPYLDREERENYTITIQVSDSGFPQHTAQRAISFRLEDINDNFPRLTSGFDIQVYERASPRLLVHLTAVDPDLGSNGTVDFYRVNVTKHSTSRGVITLQNTEIITINLSGEVWLNEELDYEDSHQYDIVIGLRDRGTPSLETFYTNITLHVINVPDSRPQFIFAVGEMVYQNSTDPFLHVGDLIAQVFATDEDSLMNNITYSVGSITWQGISSSPVPDVLIDMRTGMIYSNAEQQITPESIFVVNVLAYDNSQYNLSAEAMVHITVAPMTLAFVEPSYTTEISEATLAGTNVITVLLESLSVSSHVQYSLNVTYPSGQQYIFTLHHTNLGEVVVSTVRELDRETIENYAVIITATRGSEFAQTTVFIIVTDVNDNSPLFTDPPNTVIYVSELLPPHTTVARVNVTDRDIGDNSRSRFQLDHITPDAPFDIDVDTGDIILTEQVDYESISSFSLGVIVTDFGMPPRQSSNIYVINVINENDIPPRFSAPAYFGEIYAHIPINDYVRHTQVRVSDEDFAGEHDLLFSITSLTGANFGYAFTITGHPPYYIRVVQSPIEPNISSPLLLELQITITNNNGHGLSSTAPLYISVFTADNLLTFDLTGVTVEELMSCEERQSSICGFREALRNTTARILNKSVSFYNNSLQRSERDINVIRITMYGWYGNYYLGRDNNGELVTSRRPPSVEYISSRSLKSIMIADEILTFNATQVVPDTPPFIVVENKNNIVIILEIALGCLSSIIVALFIIFICFYRRMKKKRRNVKNAGNFNLQTARDYHEIAANVMYQDDEIMNTVQTTPFSDPAIIAKKAWY